MTRAERRHQLGRAKAKAVRVVKTWYKGHILVKDPKFVAHMAETHCRPCSCYGCQQQSRPKEGPWRPDQQ